MTWDDALQTAPLWPDKRVSAHGSRTIHWTIKDDAVYFLEERQTGGRQLLRAHKPKVPFMHLFLQWHEITGRTQEIMQDVFPEILMEHML